MECPANGNRRGTEASGAVRRGVALQLAQLAPLAPNLVQHAVWKAEIQRLYAQAFTWRKEGEG